MDDKGQNESIEAANAVEREEPSSTVTTSGETLLPKGHSSKKRFVWLFLVSFIIIVAALCALWWFVFRPVEKAPSPTVTTMPMPEVTKKPTEKPVDPLLQRFISPTTGETWFATPKQLPDQKLYSDSSYTTTNHAATYYEVGKRGDTIIILASIDGPVGSYSNLFEKMPDGTVALIARPMTDMGKNYQEPDVTEYSKTISIDTTTHYDSLSLPASITLDDGVVLQRPDYISTGSMVGAAQTTVQGEARHAVQVLGGSTVYRDERSYADTGLTDVSYSLETPAHTMYNVIYKPLPTAAKDLGWLYDNPKTSYDDDFIKPIARGCSLNSGLSRSDSLTADDLQLLATSPKGQKVYTIKNPDQSLWVKAYGEFKDYVKSDTQNKYAKITQAQFIAQHAVVVYQDVKGEYYVYIRTDMAPAYGCAKPVVYLYPTKTTRVNVRVGADVKLSEPLYDANGGWNVLARPDGQLTVDGRTYDSLFWEGPGRGEYPAIVSGTVVERSAAIATIRLQLAQQGFTQKEIDDFVAYWHDKLPNKPYIRLTWLTTDQMNQLAPLRIYPKPDTVIRTFLDFSGYDYPLQLPKQTFTAPERRGFTVTEWGGLSPYKLY